MVDAHRTTIVCNSEAASSTHLKFSGDKQALAVDGSIRDSLCELHDQGVSHMMVEGGPSLAHAFLSEGLVDRVILVQAPVRFHQPVPSGLSPQFLAERDFSVFATFLSGGDKVSYWLASGVPWVDEHNPLPWP